MKNRLIEHFLQYEDLTPSEIEAITESMDFKRYEKDSFIQTEGHLKLDSYFVLSGLVREYKLVKDEEISTDFYTEGQWIILPGEITDDPESNVNLYCLEEALVVVGNEAKAQALFERYPRLERVARRIMEDNMTENQRRIRNYLYHSPEERYLKLLNERPDLFSRVSQVNLSSYIGVKPESLSRIRKRIDAKQ